MDSWKLQWSLPSLVSNVASNITRNRRIVTRNHMNQQLEWTHHYCWLWHSVWNIIILIIATIINIIINIFTVIINNWQKTERNPTDKSLTARVELIIRKSCHIRNWRFVIKPSKSWIKGSVIMRIITHQIIQMNPTEILSSIMKITPLHHHF